MKVVFGSLNQCVRYAHKLSVFELAVLFEVSHLKGNTTVLIRLLNLTLTSRTSLERQTYTRASYSRKSNRPQQKRFSSEEHLHACASAAQEQSNLNCIAFEVNKEYYQGSAGQRYT